MKSLLFLAVGVLVFSASINAQQTVSGGCLDLGYIVSARQVTASDGTPYAVVVCSSPQYETSTSRWFGSNYTKCGNTAIKLYGDETQQAVAYAQIIKALNDTNMHLYFTQYRLSGQNELQTIDWALILTTYSLGGTGLCSRVP